MLVVRESLKEAAFNQIKKISEYVNLEIFQPLSGKMYADLKNGRGGKNSGPRHQRFQKFFQVS